MKKLKTNCELVATCLFSKATKKTKYENYQKYYNKQWKEKNK